MSTQNGFFALRVKLLEGQVSRGAGPVLSQRLFWGWSFSALVNFGGVKMCRKSPCEAVVASDLLRQDHFYDHFALQEQCFGCVLKCYCPVEALCAQCVVKF